MQWPRDLFIYSTLIYSLGVCTFNPRRHLNSPKAVFIDKLTNYFYENRILHLPTPEHVLRRWAQLSGDDALQLTSVQEFL